jgi:hypothetical protein
MLERTMKSHCLSFTRPSTSTPDATRPCGEPLWCTEPKEISSEPYVGWTLHFTSLTPPHLSIYLMYSRSSTTCTWRDTETLCPSVQVSSNISLLPRHPIIIPHLNYASIKEIIVLHLLLQETLEILLQAVTLAMATIETANVLHKIECHDMVSSSEGTMTDE